MTSTIDDSTVLGLEESEVYNLGSTYVYGITTTGLGSTGVTGGRLSIKVSRYAPGPNSIVTDRYFPVALVVKVSFPK